MVNPKGPEAGIVKRLGRLIREIGLTHYTYQYDREAALRAFLRAASVEAEIPEDRVEDLSVDADVDEPGVQGIAVPEESAPR